MSQFAENLKKNPSLLLGVFILVVCLAFGFLRASQLAKLSVAEADLNTKLDKISLNIKHSEKIDEDIQKLSELVGAIEERLFVGEERSTNIDYFYSFEEKLDIVISEVEQLDDSRGKFAEDGPHRLELYSVINYDIRVNGSFREVLRFLYEIYQIDSIMRVSEFQIDSSNNKGSETNELSAKVRVAVLARK